jgi:hypothetical protein
MPLKRPHGCSEGDYLLELLHCWYFAGLITDLNQVGKAEFVFRLLP